MKPLPFGGKRKVSSLSTVELTLWGVSADFLEEWGVSFGYSRTSIFAHPSWPKTISIKKIFLDLALVAEGSVPEVKKIHSYHFLRC